MTNWWRSLEDARAPGRSLSARLEDTPGGHFLISSVVVVVLICMLVGNLPGSVLRERLTPGLRPLMVGLGLEQDWGVFSPDPRRTSFYLFARVFYDDGSVEIWRPPARAGVMGAYRAARWQKYVEYARADDRRDALWRPLAVWVARSHAHAKKPTRVELVRTFQDLDAPGAHDRIPWTSFTYYGLDVTEVMLR